MYQDLSAFISKMADTVNYEISLVNGYIQSLKEKEDNYGVTHFISEKTYLKGKLDSYQELAEFMKTEKYTPDTRGWVPKYFVYYKNEDGTQGDLVESPTFTLRPVDPHARVALRAYAESIKEENNDLYNDINNVLKHYDQDDKS